MRNNNEYLKRTTPSLQQTEALAPEAKLIKPESKDPALFEFSESG